MESDERSSSAVFWLSIFKNEFSSNVPKITSKSGVSIFALGKVDAMGASSDFCPNWASWSFVGLGMGNLLLIASVVVPSGMMQKRKLL